MVLQKYMLAPINCSMVSTAHKHIVISNSPSCIAQRDMGHTLSATFLKGRTGNQAWGNGEDVGPRPRRQRFKSTFRHGKSLDEDGLITPSPPTYPAGCFRSIPYMEIYTTPKGSWKKGRVQNK